MIARIKGEIVDINEKSITVDTGSIAYLIYTTHPLGMIGDNVLIHTHPVIKEDSHELFGFIDPEEKRLFTILINVNGVGPRTALQMLSLYQMQDLIQYIKTGDSKAISLVPGIGKKTAEKIVIDLKDKLSDFDTTERAPQNDLIEALLSLGYKDIQIREVVKNIDTSLPFTEQIAQTLRELGK